MKKINGFIVFALLVSSCAVPTDITERLATITTGESYGSVIAKLGTPKEFKTQGNARVIRYCNYGWVADETVLIGFVDNKVVRIERGAKCGPKLAMPAPVKIPTILSNPQSAKIMLFGGKNNKTFLGCLTCSQYETSSVHSKYSDFGSRYSSSSIWNNYGDFGSRYGSYSACNTRASNPPVIVDDKGTFYAYLSLNSSKQGIRANSPSSVSGIYTWLVEEVCD